MEIGGNKMLLLKEDSFLIKCDNIAECKQLNIGKKKKFTIVEGIKLFQIMASNNATNLGRTSFWANV